MTKENVRKTTKEEPAERPPLRMPRSFLVGAAPEPRRITPPRPGE